MERDLEIIQGMMPLKLYEQLEDDLRWQHNRKTLGFLGFSNIARELSNHSEYPRD